MNLHGGHNTLKHRVHSMWSLCSEMISLSLKRLASTAKLFTPLSVSVSARDEGHWREPQVQRDGETEKETE